MPRTSYRDPKPESFWRDLIDRWRASGKSVAAFCAAQYVSEIDQAGCRSSGRLYLVSAAA